DDGPLSFAVAALGCGQERFDLTRGLCLEPLQLGARGAKGGKGALHLSVDGAGERLAPGRSEGVLGVGLLALRLAMLEDGEAERRPEDVAIASLRAAVVRSLDAPAHLERWKPGPGGVVEGISRQLN